MNRLLEVNGSGIREALRLILDYEFQQPAVLLVEEPEVHLHPALEIAMMQFLRQVGESCQVFVSTHSTNFLDTGDLCNIYLVSKDTHTNVQLLDLEEAQSRIPKELGLRLSSLFMFDRLVFVEGPSDEMVIRELAKKTDVNLAQRNIGFIRMGGVRNFTHYANEAVLSFLSRRQVEIFFLLDHDEKDNEEIRSISEKLSGKAKVKVLDKREIENYLLSPKALCTFLTKKTEHSKKSEQELSENKIAELLPQCAEKLREFTIGKHVFRTLCKPVFATSSWVDDVPRHGAKEAIRAELQKQTSSIDERQTQLDDVYGKESEAVGKNWESSKLDRVPDSELLENLFQEYGVHFHKETDSARLAAKISKDEIDKELVDFIKQLV